MTFTASSAGDARRKAHSPRKSEGGGTKKKEKKKKLGGVPNLLKRRVLIARLHAVLFLFCHRQKAAAIRGRWKTSL